MRLDEDVVLLPGLVDTHVHCNDPGRAHWEGFEHATRAAAAGGVTTLVDMPLNSVPATVDLAALETKRAAARGRCFVDVAFWGGAVPGNTQELHALWDAGVLGFKCFLVDSGVEEFPALDEAGLRDAAASVAAFGGLLLVHAEDPDAVRDAPASPDYEGFAASRPAVAEVEAVTTVVAASRATGCRVHVVHLAAAEALPVLRAAHDAGVPVTAETCPHYLTLTAADAPAGDASYKCCPPLRDAANRDGLWAGLRDGTLGMVVTDHSPCPVELKAGGAAGLADAWGGISSLQLGLAVTWTAARPRGHTLGDVARWMATGPADRAGLRHKGRIAEGADADLCVFAPDESYVVDPGPAAAPAPGHAVRRPHAHRRGAADLAGRPTGRPGRTGPRPTARPGRGPMSGDFTALPDVASRALGGGVVHVNDELFAAGENLVTPAPPVHDPRAFGPRGKVYDGWETRRRRAPGHDLAIVRLGVRSEVAGVVVDTSYFAGNYPPRVGVEAVDLPGHPSVEQLLAAPWRPLVPVSEVRGDGHNPFPVEGEPPATHVMLTLHPDGGVARLRVHGRPVPDPAVLTGTVDLAALENGGDVVDCSDAFYASARNLLMPGRARTTGEGWENARRRDAGNDHVTVRLAGRGTVRRLVVDTSCFLGNAPAEVLVRGCVGEPDRDRTDGWVTLLPRTAVQPDTRHLLPVEGDAARTPVDHVRLDVYPDGGLARFRVLGELG